MIAALGAALGGGWLAAPTVAHAQDGERTTTGREAWHIVPVPQSSLVYARDGSLIGEIGRQWRTSVPLRSLPRYLPQAFIAVEDQRFHQHDGVDVIGVLGAIRGRVLGDASRGGASTITQQLVGNLHPDIIDRRDISYSRKLREQAAARQMEKNYSKEQILEAYLNAVDFGRNWFGVEAAARHYFGKSASQVTLAEAATLAGLPKSPPQYDPIRFPDRAKQRRDLILGLMAEQGFITPQVAERTKQQPVVTAPNFGMSAPSGYFVDAVRQEAERRGIPVMNGGYRIQTTLDPVLQGHAVTALLEGTSRVEADSGYAHLTYARARGGQTHFLQGMAVAMDPFTGEVRALVGGRNHALTPFNRATNAFRQPGSAIKPLVYARALEAGIPMSELIADTSLVIMQLDTTLWEPRNYDGRYIGPVTAREALVKSRNIIAIQLGLAVSMDSVSVLSRRMGINSPMQPYPASAIGASVVRPIELVSAFTAFANNGAVVAPWLIARVEDRNGRTVYTASRPAPRQVIDARSAFIVRDMLREAVERGTGRAARVAVPQAIPVAGKTGTTNDNLDVWFIGMTPDLVAGVWLGFDQPRTITSGAVGGGLAAPIWGQMISRHYGNRNPGDWGPIPNGISHAEMDRETGEPANELTPPDMRYLEFYIEGTEPAEVRRNPWLVPRWGVIQ